MSVVQRCPNCGTTQATGGECGACHEARVRYFCANHTPGLWLDTPSCARCGARFGSPAGPSPGAATPPLRGRAAASPHSPAPSRLPDPAPASPLPGSAPPATRARERLPSERPSRDVLVSRERAWPGAEEEFTAPASRMALLQEMLRAAARARTVGRGRGRGGPRLARSAGGCLVRVLILIVLLFLALAAALFLFGRALLGF